MSSTVKHRNLDKEGHSRSSRSGFNARVIERERERCMERERERKCMGRERGERESERERGAWISYSYVQY